VRDLLLCAKHLFVDARKGLRELYRERAIARAQAAERNSNTMLN